MADSSVSITAGAGVDISTRTNASSEHMQVVMLGIDGSDTPVGTDSSNGLDVDVTRVSGTVTIAGEVAHDSADSGKPVKIGARAVAFGATPTAVAAGDITDLLANRAGGLFTLGGHPNVVSIKHANITTAVSNTAIVSASAGSRIVVTSITVTLDTASTVYPSVLIGFGTASTPTTTGVLVAHGGVPAGGGVSRGDGSGIIGIGADDEDLRITTVGNATGNGLQVVVTYFLITT